MNSGTWMELGFYFIILAILVPFLGILFAHILKGERVPILSFLDPIETNIYRLAGVDQSREMNWKEYALSLLVFSAVGFIALTILQLVQKYLPLNPQGVGSPGFLIAINTAISFVTNTNWQAYSGESTMSYLTQAFGLTVQNFLSAASGIAVMAALARGIVGKQTSGLGNFWVDLVRSTLYILLPLSLILAIILAGQGVVQNFGHYVDAKTLEGSSQILPMGPAASQIAIKQLGTNGGGFFGANSAHPFENPTPFSNFMECLSILLLPASLVYTFGILVNQRKHSIALLIAMLIIFGVGLGVTILSETQPNPSIAGLPFLEGKEVRFGIVPSVLWSNATTVASNGSVNAMHDSLSPITGAAALFNMMLGEVIFGGVGSGVYGIVLFAILTVFIAGLMVGRTPEYLGKKIETKEVFLAVLGVLIPCAAVLILTAVSLVVPFGYSAIANKGPHGLSEVLYAFTSAANNNGSAFGGLTASGPWYTICTSIAMLLGRFGVILPVLALADSVGKKKFIPPSAGTFPTDGGLFVILLISVIVIVGALTFLPALTLGPIVEHLLMLSGRTF